MKCGICGENKGRRVISGISMCEECFGRIARLRSLDKEVIAFYQDSSNLINATSEGREYVLSMLKQRDEEIQRINEERARQQIFFEQAQREEAEKQVYARTQLGLYEYDVVTILNEGHGCVNKEEMKRVLTKHAVEGWKLHTIYSNELGKNAVALLGLGVNSTACEDVLIFERKLQG